jgi:capsular polysaccharide biosynthesis protein
MTDNDRTELTRTLIRRWLVSVLIIGLAADAGYCYGALAPATYTAQAFLVSVPQVAGDTADATAFSAAYSRLATQPQILAQAAASSGIPADTLRAHTSAATSPDAPVISISGSAHDPAAAAADANAVAGALSSLASAHTADTSVRLTVLSAAAPPTRPSSPSAMLDAAIGAAAGVLLASLAALAGGAGGRRREYDAEPASEQVPRAASELDARPAAPPAATLVNHAVPEA